MAVTFVDEFRESARTRYDGKVSRHTRQFLVIVDDPNNHTSVDPILAVAAQFGLFIGSIHPGDPSAWCVDVNSDVIKGSEGTQWTVTAEYSSERELNENPLLDPAFIDWDTEQFQEPIFWYKDSEGVRKGVVNSAGDPFDPPGQRDDSRRAVVIEKNLASVPSWIIQYRDAVNSDSIVIDGIPVGVGQAKCQRVSVSRWQFRNGFAFRTVNLMIHITDDDWDYRPLDVGFRRKFRNGLIPIRYHYDADFDELSVLSPENEEWEDGFEPTAPQLLDGDGQPILNPTPEDAVFGNVRIYKRLPFSALPLQ